MHSLITCLGCTLHITRIYRSRQWQYLMMQIIGRFWIDWYNTESHLGTITKGENSVVCVPLQWRHNGQDGVSNHQPHESLLNPSFKRKSKKPSKVRATGLCAGNSPVNSPHKGSVTRKMFPFDDVIMNYLKLNVNMIYVLCSVKAFTSWNNLCSVIYWTLQEIFEEYISWRIQGPCSHKFARKCAEELAKSLLFGGHKSQNRISIIINIMIWSNWPLMAQEDAQ